MLHDDLRERGAKGLNSVNEYYYFSINFFLLYFFFSYFRLKKGVFVGSLD